MRLGVIEINTNSKIVNSIENGFKGSVAQNSPTSQDSRLGGTPHNGLYGRDTFFRLQIYQRFGNS